MAIRTGKVRLRSEKRKNLPAVILLAAAIVGGSLMISRRPQAVQTPPAAPTVVAEFDIVRLPVPAEPVPAGTRARDIALKSIAFPRHQVPEGALQSLENIMENVTTAPLPASLPLFASNFSSSQQFSNPVLERIPAGMRAMTVRVDATSAVEGWAGSGSVVDVLLIEKERTSVVAEKVKILSAERSVSPVEGTAAPSVPSTVTMLVSQEQCLAINTAIPLGRIAFALRSANDDENWLDAVYTSERLKGGSVPPDQREVVTGYIALKGEGGGKAYALSNGRWIKTEVVPPGFLAGER